MPDFIDIHAHVNFPEYDADREEVIKRAHDTNTWMINVGTDQESSQSSVDLAKKYDKGVYAIVGQHPTSDEVFDFDYYKTLASDSKVVAIGECGLDYFRAEEDSSEKQKEIFIKLIEVANEVGKPLMLHVRNSPTRSAYKEAVEILKTHAKVKGNSHFFAGDWEEAKLFLDIGYTLSFTGVITFARNYDEVIKNTPLDMIMSETDCPYVTPTPYRGKRNEPVYVQEVVKKIAEIKDLPLETVKKALVDNAFRVLAYRGRPATLSNLKKYLRKPQFWLKTALLHMKRPCGNL